MDVLRRLRAVAGADVVLAALADEPGVHVVGGALRDALLGRPVRELDLVVEGDALAVARRAARRVGGTLTIHERFGTATIRTGGFAFDLAGARRERYERPGALPVVELGATLREDLGRRDFSVNAIALRLADGAIEAWPGAREDLRAGLLRVLHERSFVDDPTRMLRLARYAARLGFVPAPRTAALVEPGLLATVSGERAGRELRLALREPQPAALLALERLGLGRELLGPAFTVPAAVVERLGAGPLALAACLTAAPPSTLARRLDELGFTAPERKLIVAAAGAQERLRASLAAIAPDRGAASGADVALWRVVHDAPPEAIELLAAGDGAAAAAARRWRDDVSRRGLAIGGADLVAAGLRGAEVGAALERATVAMLAGVAPDREAQLAAALAR